MARTDLAVRDTPAAPAPRPGTSLVAQASGAGLPHYVTREQARAMVNAATSTRDRLLLETLWQSGGRVSEVLHLRPCDLDRDEGALALPTRKQRGKRRGVLRLVYVSHDLIAQLAAYAHDGRVRYTAPLFRSPRGSGAALSRQQAWRIVTRAAAAAGVYLPARDGRPRPAWPHTHRHGAAVHQVRSGVPVSEVQQQLGHARLDTTSLYLRLANPERRQVADRVAW